MSCPIRQLPLLREGKRPRIWTVRYNETTHVYERADAAVGVMVKPGLDGAAARNDFDRISIFKRPIFNATWDCIRGKWTALVPLGDPRFSWSPTEPYCEVVYRCTPFWYRLEEGERNGPYAISVTDRPLPGFTLAPMFKNGKTPVYRPCFEMGIGEDGLPHSRAGLAPQLGNLKQLMDAARRYDFRARTESVLDWFSDAILITVELGRWRVHEVLAGNNTGTMAVTGAGLVGAKASLAAPEAIGPMAWRGKENPWKNTASVLCDVMMKKTVKDGVNDIEVCHLSDMSRFDGTLNEAYRVVGSYALNTNTCRDISTMALGGGFLYPARPIQMNFKCAAYLWVDYTQSTPITVGVGGSSSSDRMPNSTWSNHWNWEAVDSCDSRADTFGARLVLDEQR